MNDETTRGESDASRASLCSADDSLPKTFTYEDVDEVIGSDAPDFVKAIVEAAWRKNEWLHEIVAARNGTIELMRGRAEKAEASLIPLARERDLTLASLAKADADVARLDFRAMDAIAQRDKAVALLRSSAESLEHVQRALVVLGAAGVDDGVDILNTFLASIEAERDS